MLYKALLGMKKDSRGCISSATLTQVRFADQKQKSLVAWIHRPTNLWPYVESSNTAQFDQHSCLFVTPA